MRGESRRPHGHTETERRGEARGGERRRAESSRLEGRRCYVEVREGCAIGKTLGKSELGEARGRERAGRGA